MLFSVSTRVVLVAVVLLATLQTILAADSAPGPENGASAACTEIKTALHALAAAEHDESLALDLAAEGGSAAVVVEARLSALLDRTQDLRAALKRARQSAAAREPMVDQCTRMGFRALVISEKLSSDVETVLFDSASSIAQAPEIKTDHPALAPGQLPQP